MSRPQFPEIQTVPPPPRHSRSNHSQVSALLLAASLAVSSLALVVLVLICSRLWQPTPAEQVAELWREASVAAAEVAEPCTALEDVTSATSPGVPVEDLVDRLRELQSDYPGRITWEDNRHSPDQPGYSLFAFSPTRVAHFWIENGEVSAGKCSFGSHAWRFR